MRGEPQPIAGAYTPSCDQDGYYQPRQCRTVDKDGNKECWCVDRHGSKIEGATECGEQSTGFPELKLLLFENDELWPTWSCMYYSSLPQLLKCFLMNRNCFVLGQIDYWDSSYPVSNTL